MNKATVEEHEGTISGKDAEIAILKHELSEANRTMDKHHVEKRAEGTIMLELEHYKADNARMIKLLNTTKEYTEFGDFAQDNKGSVRYLAGDKKYGKAEVQGDEEDSWVPQEAFKIAHNYREKYGEGLTETLINKML
jgi:hypothetical protein